MRTSQNIGWLIRIEEFHNRLNVFEMQCQVPRLCRLLPVELISEAVDNVFKSLGYSAPTKDQKEVIMEFIKGQDVFVSMATGGGKSLCHATLPIILTHYVNMQRATQTKNLVQHNLLCLL